MGEVGCCSDKQTSSASLVTDFAGQKALGLPASACINLLSSGDDTPPKPADQPNVAATSIQAVAASNQCEASGAGQTEIPSRRTEPQAEQVFLSISAARAGLRA